MDGIVLRDWCRARQGQDFPLGLGKKFQLPNNAIGYFGEMHFHGKATSVMGCRQEVQFGKLDSPDAATILKDFVLREFLNRAHWISPDGFPGGFDVERSLYQTGLGKYGKFAESDAVGCVDWRDLGYAASADKYRWVLLTVQIHDFVMNFGPLTKRFAEAACVVVTPDFVSVTEKPEPGVQLEISVGYPFVNYAPLKNFFGFGPGKFGIAVKLYTFALLDDHTIRVRMEFAAAPRCLKVFDFGPEWPDPVYGAAALLSWFSLGFWNPDPVHTHMDTEMLSQHCRVHQSLMDGTANIFKEWRAEPDGLR